MFPLFEVALFRSGECGRLVEVFLRNSLDTQFVDFRVGEKELFRFGTIVERRSHEHGATEFL